MEMANKLVLQVTAQSFVQGTVVSKMHFWSIRYRPIFFATSSFHLCVGRWWQGVVVLLTRQASLSTPWKTSLCCKWWHNHLCEGEVFGFQYHLQVVNCLKHQLQTKLCYKLVSPSFWVTMTTDCVASDSTISCVMEISWMTCFVWLDSKCNPFSRVSEWAIHLDLNSFVMCHLGPNGVPESKQFSE